MPTNQQHGFLTWKVPGRLPHIGLDWNVIERMTVDVMGGFGVTRRRGTEVGGLLLGKIDSTAEPMVLVYDYDLVPCEYSQGPSYMLSERDLEGFRAVISRWRHEASPDQYVVGYFRSHTRDGLSLTEADAKLFHEYLNDPLAVALVVKPYATRVSEAGFFLQSDGKLAIEASPLEFQFVRAPEAMPKSVGKPASARRTMDPVETIHVESREIVKDRSPERRSPKIEGPASPMFENYYPVAEPAWKERLLWFAFTLAVFGFGGVAGYEYAGGQIPPLRAASPASELQKPAADPYNLNLSATVQDQSVLVRWDRESEVVKAAVRGVLTINEGAASKEVRLDFPELRNGTVLYHKAGSEVGFKLELYFKDNRIFTESVTLKVPQ